jgi:AhpD family alkylhydroperoxidase
VSALEPAPTPLGANFDLFSTPELMKLRASQIDGCAYCLDMHTKDARAAAKTEQWLYALNTWRESPFFSARERVALAWSEPATLIAGGVSDALYARPLSISAR